MKADFNFLNAQLITQDMERISQHFSHRQGLGGSC